MKHIFVQVLFLYLFFNIKACAYLSVEIYLKVKTNNFHCVSIICVRNYLHIIKLEQYLYKNRIILKLLYKYYSSII